MRGSVVKRGNGYSVVVELDRDPITNKRRQKWHSGFRTKKDAEAKLAELLVAIGQRTYREPSKQTFGEFIAAWLVTIKSAVRPSTHHSYSRNLALHVLPSLGSVQLRHIDASMLDILYARLQVDGRKDYAGGGLSPRSVQYIHAIIHKALAYAVRKKMLADNPAKDADPPKDTAIQASRKESTVWTTDELRTFLERTRTSRFAAAYHLLATTGLRRGEALGLRWGDLDLDDGKAEIKQTVIVIKHTVMIGAPKTKKGKRTIMLDAGTVTALREHRKRQLAERLLMGAGWTDNDLVFCHPDGTVLHPERFSRNFLETVARIGLPRIRLHDLRHGWATMALQAGIHPKAVQERLGHSNISITLGVYSHVIAGLDKEAAEQVAAMFSPVSSPLARGAGE
jgi:integrase